MTRGQRLQVREDRTDLAVLEIHAHRVRAAKVTGGDFAAKGRGDIQHPDLIEFTGIGHQRALCRVNLIGLAGLRRGPLFGLIDFENSQDALHIKPFS